jgi:hypothetical protein
MSARFLLLAYLDMEIVYLMEPLIMIFLCLDTRKLRNGFWDIDLRCESHNIFHICSMGAECRLLLTSN